MGLLMSHLTCHYSQLQNSKDLVLVDCMETLWWRLIPVLEKFGKLFKIWIWMIILWLFSCLIMDLLLFLVLEEVLLVHLEEEKEPLGKEEFEFLPFGIGKAKSLQIHLTHLSLQ